MESQNDNPATESVAGLIFLLGGSQRFFTDRWSQSSNERSGIVVRLRVPIVRRHRVQPMRRRIAESQNLASPGARPVRFANCADIDHSRSRLKPCRVVLSRFRVGAQYNKSAARLEGLTSVIGPDLQ
jgi:hypothetical protein